MRYALLAAALALTGCAGFQQGPGVIAQPSPNWRTVATSFDRERLRDWRGAFVDALRSARAGGHEADVAREGVLLEPDAALGGGPIPNGMYRCRVIKVGAKQAGLLDYVCYPAFNCRIQREGALQGFAKLTGSQRQIGSIFRGDALRQVFLGTLVLGDETASDAIRPRYRSRRRWLCRADRSQPLAADHAAAAFESQLDVMELVPVQEQAR